MMAKRNRLQSRAAYFRCWLAAWYLALSSRTLFTSEVFTMLSVDMLDVGIEAMSLCERYHWARVNLARLYQSVDYTVREHYVAVRAQEGIVRVLAAAVANRVETGEI